MKAHVNSVTYWDVFFLNKIFRLDGKKLVSAPCRGCLTVGMDIVIRLYPSSFI
jgi:hypothetical protein